MKVPAIRRIAAHAEAEPRQERILRPTILMWPVFDCHERILSTLGNGTRPWAFHGVATRHSNRKLHMTPRPKSEGFAFGEGVARQASRWAAAAGSQQACDLLFRSRVGADEFVAAASFDRERGGVGAPIIKAPCLHKNVVLALADNHPWGMYRSMRRARSASRTRGPILRAGWPTARALTSFAARLHA
jgi:hypothetical protein